MVLCIYQVDPKHSFVFVFAPVGGSAGCNATLLVRPCPLWLCHTGLAPALFAKDQCQVYIFNMGMW